MENTITLPRSGQAPLQFESSEKIATASSKRTQGPCQGRWYTLTVYRHQDGRLVLAISYESLWQGERRRDHAYACADDADLRQTISSFDFLADMIGLPPGEQFAAKQQHIEKILRQCWDAAVSRLLEDFPETI